MKAKLNDEMKQVAVDLKGQGKKITEICAIINDQFFAGQDIDKLKLYENIRNHFKRIRNKGESITTKVVDLQGTLKDLLRKPHSMAELTGKTGHSQGQIEDVIEEIIAKGIHVTNVGGIFHISKEIHFSDENVVESNWDGNKVVRIGIVSDTHIGSVYTQITHLHAMYDIFEKNGITNVYHGGDITEGSQMREGHLFETYIHSAEEFVEEVCDKYPVRKGIKTHFIIGNHDASFIKRAGFNIGNAIASYRDDMNFLGNDFARVYLTKNYPMEIRHPADGSSYAISYKPQRMIESMGKDTPKLLVIGHYHKQGSFQHRGVQAILAGSFEAQSGWMRNKGLASHVGGWIVEIHVDDDGNLQEFIPRFFPFEDIKEDYKRWR